MPLKTALLSEWNIAWDALEYFGVRVLALMHQKVRFLAEHAEATLIGAHVAHLISFAAGRLFKYSHCFGLVNLIGRIIMHFILKLLAHFGILFSIANDGELLFNALIRRFIDSSDLWAVFHGQDFGFRHLIGCWLVWTLLLVYFFNFCCHFWFLGGRNQEILNAFSVISLLIKTPICPFWLFVGHLYGLWNHHLYWWLLDRSRLWYNRSQSDHFDGLRQSSLLNWNNYTGLTRRHRHWIDSCDLVCTTLILRPIIEIIVKSLWFDKILAIISVHNRDDHGLCAIFLHKMIKRGQKERDFTLTNWFMD